MLGSSIVLLLVVHAVLSSETVDADSKLRDQCKSANAAEPRALAQLRTVRMRTTSEALLRPPQAVWAFIHSRSPHDAQSVRLLWDSGGSAQRDGLVQFAGLEARRSGTLCMLVREGVLVDEAWYFLRRFAGPRELADQMELVWLARCGSDPGLSDPALLTTLRQVVARYAGPPEVTTPRPQIATPSPEPQVNQRACAEDDRLFKALNFNSSAVNVMDYGCGPGSRLRTLADCGLGSRRVGVDIQDVRPKGANDTFEFVDLEEPFIQSLAKVIEQRGFEAYFQLIFSDVTFHHIGSEAAIRATAAQLGRAMDQCAGFVLTEWDNDADSGTGQPDLTPLYDLVHTYSSTLCLPWSEATKCNGTVAEEDIHEMWEGANTAYLSEARYVDIMRQEANLTLIHTAHFQPADILAQMRKNGTIIKDAWSAILHPFLKIFRKGGQECESSAGLARASATNR